MMTDSVVELLYATIPGLRLIAVHYWFVVHNETGSHRWEIWQDADVRGYSIGHLHRNLLSPYANVGGGPTRLDATWHDERALRIQRVIEKVDAYPFCHTYLYWPGPNSNTFAAWVLREAGIKYTLGSKALGKRFPVWLGKLFLTP